MDLVRPGLPPRLGCHLSLCRVHLRPHRQTLCRPWGLDPAHYRHDHLRDGTYHERLYQ